MSNLVSIHGVTASRANSTTLVVGTPTQLGTSGMVHDGTSAVTPSGDNRKYWIDFSLKVTSALTGNTTVSAVIGAATCTLTAPNLAVGNHLFRLVGYTISETSIDWFWDAVPEGASSLVAPSATFAAGVQLAPAISVTIPAGAATGRVNEVGCG